MLLLCPLFFAAVAAHYPRLVSGDSADMDPTKAELFEGDIIISPRAAKIDYAQHFRGRRKKVGRKRHNRQRQVRAATARADRLWPYGVIPYEIEANFSGEHRALFKQAMRYWENETCVQFVERTPTLHPDYIVFTERACGCCSFVGRRGNGAQAISIGKNCDKFGIVVHELGHVVGFWHEHTRPDRDKHVQIISRNIVSGQEYNFNQLTEDEVNSLGLQYDYESVMHYARNTFSKSTALDTILPITGQVGEIGQRVRLSSGDIAQTMLLYKCPACGRTHQEPFGILHSPGHVGPQHCVWRISATQGEKIAIEITVLDLGCDHGYLEIRDGYWNKSPLLGRLCGNRSTQGRLVSTGHRMLVTFHTFSTYLEGFQAKYEALCGGVLEQANGILQSPNYPDEYRANKECIWKITVAPGSQVALTFQAFDVEYHDNCGYDFVEVRDGLELYSKFLARLCGHKIPQEILSTDNHMMVKFFSDSSVFKMGFSATYVTEIDECLEPNHGCQQRCVNTIGGFKCECEIGFELHSDGKRCEDACGGVLKEEKGVITSPSFPDFYPSNKQCIWEVIVPPQFRITLNFTHFDLEGTSQECEYDSVEVRSSDAGQWKVEGTYCGNRLPPVLTSSGSTFRIEFVSDNSVQKTGFSAYYFTDQDECISNNGGCQQICDNTLGSYKCSCYNGFILHPNGRDCKEGSCVYQISSTDGVITSPNFPEYYPSRKECTWYFHTTPGHRIKLIFDSFELEPHQECAYDHVALYDGDSDTSPLLGRFCGSKTPHPILSTARHMLLAFRSDPSVQRNGFRAFHSTVCGGRVSASLEPAALYSHSKYGDQNYGSRMDCNWIITSPNSGKVRIQFQTFDLEPEQDCAYDYVQVLDGFESSSSLGKLCGHQVPPEMTSTGFRLLIRFQTDDSITGKGFELFYSEVASGEAADPSQTMAGKDEDTEKEVNMCDSYPDICGMEAGCLALEEGGYTCLCHDLQPTGPNNSCDRSKGSPFERTDGIFASDQLLGMLNKPANITDHSPGVLSYSLGSIGAISAVFALAVLCAYKKKQRGVQGEFKKCMQQYNPNYYSTELFKTMKELEILQHNISLQEEIGEGFFGKVYRGLLTTSSGVTLQVAVKTLKDNPEALTDFEREVDIMSSFSHENILTLLGVVVTENREPPWMIFEFMQYGDLAQLLRSSRSFNQCELVRICTQIAHGMAYLSSQHFVHRDLATRNCLVGEDMAVKISDFGLSRDIYTSDYYKVGGSRLLPIRWMAPESITYGKFSLQSDVWAYGVCLWEIFTFGKQPYFGHSNDEVVKLILQGILLSPPENCPSFVCHIMANCWKTEPRCRLTFPEILEHFQHSGQ